MRRKIREDPRLRPFYHTAYSLSINHHSHNTRWLSPANLYLMRLVVGIGVRRGGRISGITLWLFVAVVILGIIGRVYETRSSWQAVWSDTRTSLGDEFGAAPLLTVITAPRE